MSNFSEMSGEERNAFVLQKIAPIIKESGLEEINIKMSRECVCPLAEDEVEDTTSLCIDKTFSPDRKEQVDALKAKMNDVIKGDENIKLNVKILLGPGCKYETISGVVDALKGGEPVDLEHKEGEVWYIDFWASWCPPCQEPMLRNNFMVKQNKEKWGDKLKVISISIDQTRDGIPGYVAANGLNDLTHYHCGESGCQDQYTVMGLPMSFIIDTKGTIVFKGHPASRELNKDFDTLLSGGTIHGNGTEAICETDCKIGCCGGEAVEGAELDQATVMKEIDSFKEVGKELQASLKEHAE